MRGGPLVAADGESRAAVRRAQWRALRELRVGYIAFGAVGVGNVVVWGGAPELWSSPSFIPLPRRGVRDSTVRRHQESMEGCGRECWEG
jgi:hypothetical protein